MCCGNHRGCLSVRGALAACLARFNSRHDGCLLPTVLFAPVTLPRLLELQREGFGAAPWMLVSHFKASSD